MLPLNSYWQSPDEQIGVLISLDARAREHAPVAG